MTQRQFRTVFVLSLLLLDVGALVIAFGLAFATRFYWAPFLSILPAEKGIPLFNTYQSALYVLLPVWILVFHHSGFYRDDVPSAYDEFVRVVKGVVLASLLSTAMSFAYRGSQYSRLFIALWSAMSIVLLYGLRQADKAIFQHFAYRNSAHCAILVIGRSRAVEALRRMSSYYRHIQPFFMESAPTESELRGYIKEHGITEILMMQGALPASSILDICQLGEKLDIECKIVPELLEMRRGEIIVDGYFGLPTFHLKPLSLHGANYYLKRSFDITCSILVLTVISIPLLIISFLIRVDSPGPILYTQERVGFRGLRFKFFKFRTMVSDADSMIEELKHKSDRPGPVFKMRNDPRVTSVGRWLRRYSLDEIPQIINVLRGDMSLVGPRPQVVWEAAHYDEHAKKRLRVKPGITGLWQVSGRAALSFEEMINLDIYYLENWSLGLDLKILLRTIPAVFSSAGAY